MAKLSSTHIFGNLVVDGNIISDGNIDGNADTASKVNNSIKIRLNGGTTENTNQFTFDGSEAKNVNITPSSIGAATTEYVDEHVQAASKVAFSDNQTLQQKLDSGVLNGKSVSFLVVTEAEYNAIVNKDPNVIYLIKEEY